jgi:hypothetical protein
MATSAVPQEVGLKERFFRYFQHEVTALQEQMERLNNTSFSGGERNDAVDHCLAGIERLSHEVKDASSYIPAYDQRTYGEVLSPRLLNCSGLTYTRLSKHYMRSFKESATPSLPPRNFNSKRNARTPPPSLSPTLQNSRNRTDLVFQATIPTTLQTQHPLRPRLWINYLPQKRRRNKTC